MKKISGKLRLELAQFRELQAFVQFASDLDEDTKKQIARGQLLVEILKQTDGEPLSFDKQVIIIYAATNGYMDDVDLKDVKEFELGLSDFLVKIHKKDVVDPLILTGELRLQVVDNYLFMQSTVQPSKPYNLCLSTCVES